MAHLNSRLSQVAEYPPNGAIIDEKDFELSRQTENDGHQCRWDVICNPMCILPASLGSFFILLLVFVTATLIEDRLSSVLEGSGGSDWMHPASVFVFGLSISAWSIYNLTEQLRTGNKPAGLGFASSLWTIPSLPESWQGGAPVPLPVGSGAVGFRNLGNSCYMAAPVQVRKLHERRSL